MRAAGGAGGARGGDTMHDMPATRARVTLARGARALGALSAGLLPSLASAQAIGVLRAGAHRAPSAAVAGDRATAARAIGTPGAGVGEDTLVVRDGAEVRLVARSLGPGWRRARVERADADSLRIRLAQGGPRLVLARDDLARLDVRHHVPGAVRASRVGAWLGAGLGGGAGALIGRGFCGQGECTAASRRPGTYVGFALGALLGAAGGAFMGDLVERPRWRPARLPARLP